MTTFSSQAALADLSTVIGTALNDTHRAQNDSMLFTVQGNDELYGSQQFGEVSVLIGGTGRDNYYGDSGSIVIADAGGGYDKLVLSGWSYWEYLIGIGKAHAATIDDRHFFFYNDYDKNKFVIIGDYQSEHSAIETLVFKYGHSIPFSEAVTAFKSSNNYMGNLSWEQVRSKLTGHEDLQPALNTFFEQYTALNASYESGGEAVPDSKTDPLTAKVDDVAQVARLYKAAFNRDPDVMGLNYWVDQWESGLTIQNIASSFMQSQEFYQRYANPADNQLFIESLYENALGRTADTAGVDYWMGKLNDGRVERNEMLVSFSDSVENIANTDLIFYQQSSDGDWLFS